MNKKETISIVKFREYDGKYEETVNTLYFKSKEEAKNYLKKAGYEEDDIFEYRKNWGDTASLKQVKLQ